MIQLIEDAIGIGHFTKGSFPMPILIEMRWNDYKYLVSRIREFSEKIKEAGDAG